ncbi:hypothetical protein [Nodularia sphaerocarpa]|uniref:hypothetical protein n=1 Tax=Nodularia sphaerocarpa TaxID=137816 RepID=UPI001EFA910C|nr:hypothetical protein [Nodularia sphaerocarpa]MDB9374310.1 hypothetical protein [Nodularia sphaerocarpa CS-585]MDB9376466.1 hypothetical protein [Nodularia sphaerocarpa CS-585A2]ULP74146.1 hypothetical protein BDGGKGIB_03809 [Nodularia sphaerocarpa UHCC 0038]
MDGLDFKNLVEIVILISYAIAILYKLATVESSLKHRINNIAARIDLSITQENGKRAIIEKDFENLRYEVSEKLTHLLQSQKELQGVIFGRDYTQR